MSVERMLRVLGGLFVLVSLALGHWVSPYWYLFTAFVGLNLFQSGFTNWCPMMAILQKVGLKRSDTARPCCAGTADDARSVTARARN